MFDPLDWEAREAQRRAEDDRFVDECGGMDAIVAEVAAFDAPWSDDSLEHDELQEVQNPPPGVTADALEAYIGAPITDELRARCEP